MTSAREYSHMRVRLGRRWKLGVDPGLVRPEDDKAAQQHSPRREMYRNQVEGEKDLAGRKGATG